MTIGQLPRRSGVNVMTPVSPTSWPAVLKARAYGHVLAPRLVRTDFGADDQAWFFSVISHAGRPFLKTPAQGAQTSTYLASSPEMDVVTGRFVVNGMPKAANKVAYDPAMLARL